MLALTPDGRGSVRMADVGEPRPRPDEAVVAVAAFSVNRGETLLLEAPADGWRPGKDVAGTVLVAAADGSGPPAGTRVVGHAAGAGWAQRAAVPASGLAALPETLPATTAAALPLAGFTALRLLRAAGPLLGRRLLVTGASGGVGHYLAELAVGAGAEVTALTASTERGARLRDMGARTVTGVDGAVAWFDVAMESIGGPTFTAVRRKVRPEGVVLWFGQAGRQPITVDFFDWIGGTAGARIVPFHYARGGRADAEDLTTLVRLVTEGRLHPEIGSVLDWRDTARAIDELRARKVRGNTVLEIPS